MDLINQWIEYLEYFKNLSSNTIEQYRFNVLRYFRCFCTSRKLTLSNDIVLSITTKDLIEYLIKLSKVDKISASGRANIIFSLKSLYGYLYRFGILKTDPTLNLDIPKLPERLPCYLSLSEAEKLLSSSARSNNEFRERNFAIITLIINCGFRVSEVSGMNISDIRENKITVIGKRNKQREVPLNESCIEVIDRYLKVRSQGLIVDPEPLFLSRRGKRMSTDIIQLIVKEALEEAGLDPKIYSVHKLRHTAATLMYQYTNCDIAKIKEILGHDSIQTTMIYTHISSEQLRNVIDTHPLNKNYLT